MQRGDGGHGGAGGNEARRGCQPGGQASSTEMSSCTACRFSFAPLTSSPMARRGWWNRLRWNAACRLPHACLRPCIAGPGASSQGKQESQARKQHKVLGIPTECHPCLCRARVQSSATLRRLPVTTDADTGSLAGKTTDDPGGGCDRISAAAADINLLLSGFSRD